MNGFSVCGHGAGRKQGTRRLVHEWHKFVRKTGHGATDADAANIGAPTYTGHPTTLANITLNNRPPTAQFDDALNIAIAGGEVGLLVVAATISPFVDGLTKKPGRAKRFVQRDHGSPPRGHMKQVE